MVEGTIREVESYVTYQVHVNSQVGTRTTCVNCSWIPTPTLPSKTRIVKKKKKIARSCFVEMPLSIKEVAGSANSWK